MVSPWRAPWTFHLFRLSSNFQTTIVLLIPVMSQASNTLRRMKLKHKFRCEFHKIKRPYLELLLQYIPCNFLRWNRGLPKKLFLMFVSRVFHSWLLALLQVDAVIAGDGVFPAFAPPWCGEFGAGPRGRRRKIMFSILVEEFRNEKLLTIAILWFLEQTNSYCWTWVGSMMGTRLLLIVIFVWLIGWL